VLWEPACGGLGAYEARGGLIRARAPEDKVDPAQAVACMSVEGAEAYCQSQGKRLPTEAEWELAAGGRAKRWLPWDPTGKLKPKCEDAVFARGDDGRCKHLLNRAQAANDGDRDVTPEGVRALGGNVSEWARIDAASNAVATFVACGGNWDGPAVSMHPAKRLRVASSVEYVAIGFRCALTPQAKTEVH
jgi:formylglycine-generating enzyme required for sulfatase activity